MTLLELIQRFRVDAFDLEQPYLFADSDITHWFNDAVKEAAIRGRLIHESVNPLVCTINVLPGVSVYPLHEALYEIECIYLFDAPMPTRAERLYQISQEDIADRWHDWRTRTGRPEYAIQHDTSIRLSPTPTNAAVIKMEGYRIPLVPMILDSDRPEVNIIHHEQLIQWALYKAFSKPDGETFDPSRAAIAEQNFTDYFGIRPNSNLRRSTREDIPHTVKPFDL